MGLTYDAILGKLRSSDTNTVVTGGLNPLGAYNGATAYAIGDSVDYLGSSYIAIAITTGNLPTDTTHWQVLANKGNTGATGSAGATGAQGPAGNDGAAGTNGTNGNNGTNGQGVPTGGTANQLLQKIDTTDYNTQWHTPVKADVGLGSVDNTTDAGKPVSTAQQTALDLKANLASPTFTGTVGGITKSMVGLGNVVNSDTTTTANITDSTDKRFITDAQRTVLGNTSGTNTGDQNLSSYETSTHAAATYVPLPFGVPTGALIPYGGAAAPTGWLLCDGSSVLRSTYSALFTAIGTAYGTVDGTHFTVPDLRSAFPKGKGGALALGDTGGAATHTPAGTVSQPTLTMDSYTPAGSVAAPTFTGTSSQSTSQATSSITINNESTHTHTQGATGSTATGISIGTSGAGSSHSHSITQSAITTTKFTTSATGSAAYTGGGVVTTPSGTEAAHTHAAGTITDNGHTHTNPTTAAGSAHTHTITEPNAGAGHSHTITATGTNSAPAFTGNAATLTGTVSQPTFTGSSANTEPLYQVFNYIIKT